MKQNHNSFKMLLSSLCIVVFLFLAVASVDEKRGGSNGYTPSRIEENPETDFSSDISEDEREEEVEYVSQTDEDEEEQNVGQTVDDEEEYVGQTVDDEDPEPSGSALQEQSDIIN